MLDCVLKFPRHFGNHIAGYYVVQRAMNMVTKVLKYCLETCLASIFPAAGEAGAGMPSDHGKTRS